MKTNTFELPSLNDEELAIVEAEILAGMTKLIVRTPNGLDRIYTLMHSAVQAWAETTSEMEKKEGMMVH